MVTIFHNPTLEVRSNIILTILKYLANQEKFLIRVKQAIFYDLLFLNPKEEEDKKKETLYIILPGIQLIRDTIYNGNMGVAVDLIEFLYNFVNAYDVN